MQKIVRDCIVMEHNCSSRSVDFMHHTCHVNSTGDMTLLQHAASTFMLAVSAACTS